MMCINIVIILIEKIILLIHTIILLMKQMHYALVLVKFYFFH